MQRIIVLFFLLSVLAGNIFSMNSSSYDGLDNKRFYLNESEMIEHLEINIFPKMRLILGFIGSTYIPDDFIISVIQNIYLLFRRKTSYFKKSWKVFVENMSNEDFGRLDEEVEFLSRTMESQAYNGFLLSIGVKKRVFQ